MSARYNTWDSDVLKGAVALIAGFEGFRERPYRTFTDEPWTVGYGDTDPEFVGQFFPPGPPCPEDVARTRLQMRVADYLAAVRRWLAVPTPSGVVVPMVSLAYNIGGEAFRTSTMLRWWNARRWRDALGAWAWWNRAGGAPVPGLVERRDIEIGMAVRAIAHLGGSVSLTYALKRAKPYSDRETGESRFVPVYDLPYVHADGAEAGPFSKFRTRVYVRLADPRPSPPARVRVFLESKVLTYAVTNRTEVIVPDESGSVAALANDGSELVVSYEVDVIPFE